MVDANLNLQKSQNAIFIKLIEFEMKTSYELFFGCEGALDSRLLSTDFTLFLSREYCAVGYHMITNNCTLLNTY